MHMYTTNHTNDVHNIQTRTFCPCQLARVLLYATRTKQQDTEFPFYANNVFL